MENFRINYYDSDYGGMRTELTRSEIFTGTFPAAVKHVESTKSPWGRNYTASNSRHCCTATITEVSDKELRLERKIKKLNAELAHERSL